MMVIIPNIPLIILYKGTPNYYEEWKLRRINRLHIQKKELNHKS